ncbi:MAG: phenylalanine--tRNA ligase subunit alpha [Candidatus Altiarchaeota archaeon]
MDFHPHEVKVLKALKAKTSPEDLAQKAGIPLDAVMRATSWLRTKKLIEVEEKTREIVSLDDEGKQYLKQGLPERQLIKLVGKEAPIVEVKKKLGDKKFGIAVGWLRKKGQGALNDGKVTILNDLKTADEELLESLGEKGQLTASDLDERLGQGLAFLKSRKSVVKIKEKKDIIFSPTAEGKKAASSLKEDGGISQLTPEMIKSGSWKEANFRSYDVSTYVEAVPAAKFHPLKRMIQKVRDVFISMGFAEIEGPLVESAFWNFDALFQPQDHPARDMHDTFYLKNPKKINIEKFDELKDKVKKTHETGWDTGSTGWRYKWSEETAKKTLMRTHTTSVTARYLSSLKKEDLPAKVFCIGKAFRNEAVDYKHLPEFFQVEGIVVDPSVNFRHLLGILEKFYNAMGFKKVRFRPAYFPYTEMSVEPEVYFEERKEWIELGGSGIFRPEVVKPLLGFDCPVLAWGLGLDRVVSLALGLKDIRQLYISDLDWLRSAKIV